MHWQLGCSSPLSLSGWRFFSTPIWELPKKQSSGPYSSYAVCALTRLFPCSSYCEQKSVFFNWHFCFLCQISHCQSSFEKPKPRTPKYTHTNTHKTTKQKQKMQTQNQALDPNVLKNFRQFFNLPTCPLCPSSGSKTIFATPSNQPIAINTVPRFWFFWI